MTIAHAAPADTPDDTPDDAGRNHALRVVAASRRGTAHVRDGRPGQDRGLVLHAGTTVVALVADGVGSAPRSDIGAAAAVLAAGNTIATTLDGSALALPPGDLEAGGVRHVVLRAEVDAPELHWPTLLRAAAAAACHEVRRLDGAARPGDHATTLGIVVLTPQRVHTAQIGDGFTVLWRRGDPGGARLLAHEEPDPDRPSATSALSSPHAMRALTVADEAADEDTSVLLSTDGIEPILVTRWWPARLNTRLLDALARRQQSAAFGDERLAALLDSDEVCGRTDDDKTVVLLAAGIAGDPPAPPPDDTPTVDFPRPPVPLPDVTDVPATPAVATVPAAARGTDAVSWVLALLRPVRALLGKRAGP